MKRFFDPVGTQDILDNTPIDVLYRDITIYIYLIDKEYYQVLEYLEILYAKIKRINTLISEGVKPAEKQKKVSAKEKKRDSNLYYMTFFNDMYKNPSANIKCMALIAISLRLIKRLDESHNPDKVLRSLYESFKKLLSTQTDSYFLATVKYEIIILSIRTFFTSNFNYSAAEMLNQWLEQGVDTLAAYEALLTQAVDEIALQSDKSSPETKKLIADAIRKSLTLLNAGKEYIDVLNLPKIENKLKTLCMLSNISSVNDIMSNATTANTHPQLGQGPKKGSLFFALSECFKGTERAKLADPKYLHDTLMKWMYVDCVTTKGVIIPSKNYIVDYIIKTYSDVQELDWYQPWELELSMIPDIFHVRLCIIDVKSKTYVAYEAEYTGIRSSVWLEYDRNTNQFKPSSFNRIWFDSVASDTDCEIPFIQESFEERNLRWEHEKAEESHIEEPQTLELAQSMLLLFTQSIPVASNKNQGEFTRYYIAADGNCLFSAICSLYNRICDPAQQYDQSRLRAEIVQELRTNPSYAAFIFDMNVQDYANEMSQNGVWGGEPEITIAANLLGIKIVVINAGNGSEDSVSNRTVYNEQAGNHRQIFLRYNGTNHYDALIPNEQHPSHTTTAQPSSIRFSN